MVSPFHPPFSLSPPPHIHTHIIDLIVVGTGMKVERINQSITDYLRKKGITLEIQDTVSTASLQPAMYEELPSLSLLLTHSLMRVPRSISSWKKADQRELPSSPQSTYHHDTHTQAHTHIGTYTHRHTHT